VVLATGSTSLERAKWAAVAAGAVLAFTAFLGDARGQSHHVNDFSCSTTPPFGVNVDVGGLGNDDICVIGTTDINLNCACAGGGGNCTSDAKKNTTTASTSTAQEVQSKNGRVNTTITIPFAANDAQCTTGPNPLTCPSGQREKLVSFAATGHFQLCISGPPMQPGQACGCAEELDAVTCNTSGTPFPGKRNSCSALFP
jgi:hypothetical protein